MTLHKYIYANLNPTLLIDPSGFFGIKDVLTASSLIGLLAVLGALNTTPLYHGDNGGSGLSLKDATTLEMLILQESKRLEMSDPEGSAESFAQLMQYAASTISPTKWLTQRRLRSQYLQVASDMFTPSLNKGQPLDYNKFPLLGNSGPRSLGRPAWLQEQVESSNWRVYITPDVEDNTNPTRRITGRRSHFIANANLGPVAGAVADLRTPENSKNDMVVNDLGRAFGMQLANGTISQFGIASWIRSTMA